MNPFKLHDQLDKITTRHELAEFILSLREDLINNPSEWENPNLERFLESMSGWIVDMHGYFQNIGEPFPEELTWELFGRILLAARSYE